MTVREGRVAAAGHSLEYRLHPGAAARPPLVLLHEGLGSLSLWRDFPERLAAATGCPLLVYSRYGYGGSDPLQGRHGVDYMHREALEALPELLDGLAIAAPILVGHSDGGSIALIHAGAGIRPVAGVVTLAAHVFVENLSVDSIAAARTAWETTDLKARLARHHADPEGAFRGWNDIWLDPAFRDWNIEGYLPGIACPVLAIQGADDEYGTDEQVKSIAAGVAGPCETLLIPACGHSPQRDQPETTLAAIAGFVAAL